MIGENMAFFLGNLSDDVVRYCKDKGSTSDAALIRTLLEDYADALFVWMNTDSMRRVQSEAWLFAHTLVFMMEDGTVVEMPPPPGWELEWERGVSGAHVERCFCIEVGGETMGFLLDVDNCELEHVSVLHSGSIKWVQDVGARLFDEKPDCLFLHKWKKQVYPEEPGC
jgi:hypothetical protein